MNNDKPLDAQLPPCPHCKALVEPTGIPKSWVRVRHEADCFYALIAQRDMMIPRDWWEAWSRRAEADSRTASVAARKAAEKIWKRIDSEAHLTLPNRIEIQAIIESELMKGVTPDGTQ